MNNQLTAIFAMIMNFFSYLFSLKKPIAIKEVVVENPVINNPATPVIVEELIESKPVKLGMSGSDFGKLLINVPPNDLREAIIFKQIILGNTPDFMKKFVEITIKEGDNIIKYNVSPDVLCIGYDDDFLRVPLNPLTAQKIADSFNCILPTRKIANQIWKNAQVKLKPEPNGPPYDDTMQLTEKFISHNNKIEKQRANRTGLITGHKKDVIISKALLNDNSKVAIYGWFLLTGAPIQPLNAVSHNKYYKDYSHGIRLVSRNVIVNDKQYDIYDILKDTNLCNLISDEGAYKASSIYLK